MISTSSGVDEILYVHPEGRGWAPIHAMAQLAAQLLEARLTVVDDRELSRARRGTALLPRVGRRKGVRLTIASNPAQLVHTGTLSHWLPGYSTEAAWVVDSFWTDRIPRFATGGRFDHIFIFDGDLESEWQEATGSTVSFLPWGTDTMALDPVKGERPIDVLRVGRQPVAYDNDDEIISAARTVGLEGQGRPPFAADPSQDQVTMLRTLGSTKAVLAFGTKHAPGAYTHPNRDYLTARWVDALGQGAIVAGSVPDCRASRELLWDGATIDLNPADLGAGMEDLATALHEWTPEVAADLRQRAQERLDWRHRFIHLCEQVGRQVPSRLLDELG